MVKGSFDVAKSSFPGAQYPLVTLLNTGFSNGEKTMKFAGSWTEIK